MLRYGSDKPDLRFGLEIQDATEITRGSQFGVFANAPAVRFLVAPRAFSRAELARLEEIAKEWGAKGLAYLVSDESGEVRSPIAKFLSEQELAAFARRAGQRPSSSPPTSRRPSRGCSAACARISAASSSSPTRRGTSSSGSSTSRCSSATRTPAAGRSSTTRSPA